MTMDTAWLWSFFAVFVRASAMMISSPVFSAQSTPLQIRIFTTLSISAALTAVLQPKVGAMPEHFILMIFAVASEALAGLLIGIFTSFAFHAAQMAGTFLDFQVGLGMSQIVNPATGVPSTLIGQFKYMLAITTFLAMNGHHSMIHAFAASYDAYPGFNSQTLTGLEKNLMPLFGTMCLLALQIAAPVAAVSLVVDSALGVVNKAVPQMQVFMVGMPAKILLGLIALSLSLPALTAGVDNGVRMGLETLFSLWKEGK